ncbi:nucleoside triphosphate pyrophosphohydrolase family protein [Paenibacillus apiarius]|uniref:DUF1573 domain-containing protein n=1 Tax=Paenibacillus apiarius TaxID=46240 RepID=A0ABT4DXB0_9BACL|nr:DUF1573 domain-containing protein [Paenibacillus apiarius]MBN3523777.1 DUF1573 domain-containing protein [Paenibacillus apiarius]MCY9516239.1 DUF1573 domain-containing protein [Paenibacillus apiarius]MCY9520708.1 DUF1573 domain-containing protein [Paenibacillus apiarius]MCY9552563.1 DUF1573 domain-containing protein [Paenibacillus apiarius]MCY9560963.1 DUF1573 domain-containing protein [Paenibacillus apiarius]
MSTPSLQTLQDQVADLLLRHRSLLDILSKYGQSDASVNRAVTKAITECGCLELHATRQPYCADMDVNQAKQSMESHVQGNLCDHCKDVVKSELGKHLFYMSALCNLLDIELNDVVKQESSKCSTLGIFNLS